jgi:hypothetical protein
MKRTVRRQGQIRSLQFETIAISISSQNTDKLVRQTVCINHVTAPGVDVTPINSFGELIEGRTGNRASAVTAVDASLSIMGV